jgi:hypothetical protein
MFGEWVYLASFYPPGQHAHSLSDDVAGDLGSRAHVVDHASALARQHVREGLEDANPSA